MKHGCIFLINLQKLSVSFTGNVDFETLFSLLHRRLRAPEWEMRQNALRVLKDIIPLLDTDMINERVEKLLADVTANLGHPNPGVRKAAVDTLRSYLARHPVKADNFVRDLVTKAVINPTENSVNQEQSLGVTIALPFLLTHVDYSTVKLVIHSLLDNLIKVTNQDIIVKSLLRVKEKLGSEVFKEHLLSHWKPGIEEEFENICKVYGLPEKTVAFSDGDVTDDGQEVEARLVKYDRRPETANVGKGDRVILETEIRLRSGSAITMKIHEESGGILRQDSIERYDIGR